jgi:hypothetical protein
VPHYELPPPALSQPAPPPRYTENYDKGEPKRSAEDDKGKDRKSLWERITDDAVAFVTLCLTGVTAVLAASTVGLWIATGIAGKRQSGEMKASIAVSREAMVVAQRAYVSVRSIRLTAISVAEEIIALDAMVILENTGNTPTKNMIYHSSMKIFDGDIPGEFDFPDLDQRRPRRSFIGPKTWSGAFTFTIGREELIATQAGRRRIFVWGWADYDDTFAGTPRHRTEFCREIFAVPGVPLVGHAQQWAGASQYGRHNAADDECDRRPKPYVTT